MKLPLSKDIENRYLTLGKCAEFGCLPEVLNIKDIALLMSSFYDIADYIYEDVIERAVRSGELISLTKAERIAVDNSHPMPPIPPGKNVILQGFFRYCSFVDFPGGSEQNHLFHRDAFSAWLKQRGEWPLPKSCLLSRWWPPGKTIHSKSPHRIDVNEPHEVDEFVKSLTIYPENDDTINIQIPGKKAEPFTGHSLGFHKIGKEWRLLQKIIREGSYCTRSTKTKDGDANRALFKTVNKKMIEFLNKEFDVQIPPRYKLFEKPIEDKQGTWKPKFRIQPAGKFSDRTKEQIVKEIEVEFTKDKENRDEDRLQELCLAAVEKGASEDEIRAIICEKHENIEQYEYKKEGGHITNIP